jgi:hypothetical protein
MTLLVKPNKKLFLIALGVLLGLSMSVGYAAFMDKGKILGSTFSVGSSDLKLLKDLSQGGTVTNLADEMQGPSFSNISSNWTSDYYLKLYNNATGPIVLPTNAYYETVNDPDDLRSIIFVEPFEWNDDGDGVFEVGELGTSYGRKTIVKWKTEGFSLGQLEVGGTKGLVLRFSTDSVSETKQGKSGSYDFEFGATTLN